MKKILLITLLFYFSFINAQISFEKGYFISNDGKRTECLIKNLDWKNNPIDFRYKIDPNDNDYITETISNVSEFGIGNFTIFKRAKVKIDRSSDDLAKISQTGKPVWEENTIFLRVLVSGDATLYSYRDANLIRYFYETKEVELEQLIYLRYIEAEGENASKNLKENTYFKQQLNINVKSSNTSDNDIKSLNYTKSDLTKYFLKFNKSTNTAGNSLNTLNEELSKTKKSIYFIKVTAGLSSVSTSMKGSSIEYRNISLDNKTNFKIGLEGEYVMPFNKNKWSVFINPMYQTYDDQKSYTVPGLFSNSPVENHNVEIKYSGIQVPLGVRHYLFLNDNSKLFINAAFVFDISSKTTIVYDEIKKSNSNPGSNLAFGLGYNFRNKLSAEVRINTTKELMNQYGAFSSEYKAIDLIFAYTIF
jgi:hypothetical protein